MRHVAQEVVVVMILLSVVARQLPETALAHDGMSMASPSLLSLSLVTPARSTASLT